MTERKSKNPRQTALWCRGWVRNRCVSESGVANGSARKAQAQSEGMAFKSGRRGYGPSTARRHERTRQIERVPCNPLPSGDWSGKRVSAKGASAIGRNGFQERTRLLESCSLGKTVPRGIPICTRRIGTVSCRRVHGGTGIEIGLNNSLD